MALTSKGRKGKEKGKKWKERKWTGMDATEGEAPPPNSHFSGYTFARVSSRPYA